MKICMIGNSHIACVKKAWDNCNNENIDFELTFFGSHAATLLNTKSDSVGIYPLTSQVSNSFELTSGGKTEIIFDDYDVFVLHGFSPSLRNYSRLLKYFEKNFVTKKFRDYCFTYLSETMGRMIENIDKANKPIYITPRPCVSVRNYDTVTEGEKISDDLYHEVLSFVSSEFLNKGFYFLPQPLDTLVFNNFTRKEFNESGIGLGASPKKDNSHVLSGNNLTHMNELYGKSYLNNLLKSVCDVDMVG